MNLEHHVADILIERLNGHSVEVLTGDQGNICFFVDPTLMATRRRTTNDYDRGMEEGAIRELQQLIHSSPLLKRAIFNRLSPSASAAGARVSRNA